MAGLRTIEELTAEVAASIDATRLRNLHQVLPAALRVSAYLARYRPHYLEGLADAGKIDLEDFIILLRHNGISSERYEG